MSKFNIGAVNNATIHLGNGEELTVKELSVKIDGKLVIDKKQISIKIQNGILLITTK